jgi:hypothetical protein
MRTPSWRIQACLAPGATSRSVSTPSATTTSSKRLGFVWKNSTSWSFLSELHDVSYQTADAWLAAHGDDLGVRLSLDVKAAFVHGALKVPAPPSRET